MRYRKASRQLASSGLMPAAPVVFFGRPGKLDRHVLRLIGKVRWFAKGRSVGAERHHSAAAASQPFCSVSPIGEHATEPCACCGRDTGVDYYTPIGQRPYYAAGQGQFCRICFGSE